MEKLIKKKTLKSLVALSAGAMIFTTLSPATLSVAHATSEDSEIVLSGGEVVFDESNPNYVKAVTALEQEYPEMAELFVSHFEGRTVQSEDLEDVMDEWLDVVERQSQFQTHDEQMAGIVQPASIIGGAGLIISIITLAAADIRGAYELGQYGARQAVGRGILSRAQYQATPGRYRTAITVAFGPTTALGFDDYMFGI